MEVLLADRQSRRTTAENFSKAFWNFQIIGVSRLNSPPLWPFATRFILVRLRGRENTAPSPPPNPPEDDDCGPSSTALWGALAPGTRLPEMPSWHCLLSDLPLLAALPGHHTLERSGRL
ncbi:hypothetical protein DPEC_G00139380 [Dallia pectoralis]|uniref:Uncharacterized protein n=1 Tax=Dallia pectoralis TaxID=75939 RepID=A0ACC2GMQ7_DALPE|nr:hypothetical protein DPEC_G00139380 [Dallia pectoralis]